ncbi:PQQ-binding-like beta-propeller repeat protein [Kibdelosporangium philippinense]|uniref:PQQ-binding-like beta-propeller repeat protein n=1 Tax=Kibdelosporangium philippinense TaxID=211113 RepID=A0ABS8ZP44_9PSEU|nr:PQQ-binding-like beta-propeller repeat protein [Kibdelosporangium philippinense]MCE7008411.1 PQQ-binding-like beta-propeller repeat protein [Kibdelosporangium philippinense]
MPDTADHDGHGTEDVLDGPVHDDPPRPPRTSFHRRRDFIAVALIVVAVVAGWALIGTTSDFAATSSQTASDNVETPEAPSTLPPSFGEAWRAPSDATPIPVAVGPTVVTGNGREVIGRDPLTGKERWRYARDIPLCTVGEGFNDAVALFRKPSNALSSNDPYKQGNCSEVTSLDATTGERDHQRNGDAEKDTQLLSGGSHLTTTGKRLINTWRNDLVQTMEYGAVPDIANPDKQPRVGCTYGSIAVTQGRIGVIERCPSASDATVTGDDRLTVYNPDGKENESDTPIVFFSNTVGGSRAQIIAMNENYTAIALPDPSRIQVYDSEGKRIGEYPISVPESDFANDPARGVVSVTKSNEAVFWFTGTRTIGLTSTDFRPLWTVENTLGPGVIFAGYLLLPVKDAYLVTDPVTGARVAQTAVNRDEYNGPVQMSTLGPMVLEQRGSTLVALR